MSREHRAPTAGAFSADGLEWYQQADRARHQEASLYYPLTVSDFLDRAETVYPDRVGIVDEPDQPATSLGSLTYREVAANARAQAAKLDALGVPVGGRVAIVSQNSARLFTSFFGVSGY